MQLSEHWESEENVSVKVLPVPVIYASNKAY